MEVRTIDTDKEKKAQAVLDSLLYSPIRDWEKFQETVRMALEPDAELIDEIEKAYYKDATVRHNNP